MTDVTVPLPDGNYAQLRVDDGVLVVYTNDVGDPPSGDTTVRYDSNVTKSVVVGTINALLQLLTRMPP